MTKQLRKDFQRFLNSGVRAKWAIGSARILAEWRKAEQAGLVRIQCDEEMENYFDVYGEPDNEKERKAIEHEINCHGCVNVYSQVNIGSEASGDQWEVCDSVGMCVYAKPLDPFDNSYVIDLMASALNKIPQPGNVDELCTALD